MTMMTRVTVEEREYAVVARPKHTDENGEEIPKSDRVATAIRVAEHARASGYPARLVDDDNGETLAAVELGDTYEEEFEEVTGFLNEVASW
jgi:hypothetical protein